MRHNKPAHLIPASMESAIAEAVDAWVETLPQADKEMVRLHLYNLRAKINHPGFGEKAAKCLLAVTYLEVDTFLREGTRP